MSFSDTGFACHQTAAFAIRTFASVLEGEAKNGAVPVAVIRRLCDLLAAAPGPLSGAYVAAHASCATAFAHDQILQQRRNALGRLLVKSFASLFDNPASGVERAHLGQFFEAIKIILGADTYERLGQACQDIVADLAQGESLPWEVFYVDARAGELFERVLIDVVRAFQRFEIRRDWFLTIMNHNAAYQSIGRSSFVRKGREESTVAYFGPRQLDLVLGCMFVGLRDCSDQRRQDFLRRQGIGVEALCGPMMLHLTKARAWPS